MVLPYTIGSIVSVLAWIPILIKFSRAWTTRRNPISLAICAIIMMVMWTSIGGIWVVTHKIENHVFLFATVSASFAVAINTHVAFYWSKKRFADERARHQ